MAPDLYLVSHPIPSCSLSNMLVHHVLLLISLDTDASPDRAKLGVFPKMPHTGQGVAVPPQLVVPWLVQWAAEQRSLAHTPLSDPGLLHQG